MYAICFAYSPTLRWVAVSAAVVFSSSSLNLLSSLISEVLFEVGGATGGRR